MADGVAADLRRRARASGSSGTWAGCTTRCKYFAHDPIHRKYHQNDLTFRMLYAFNENFVLPLSHDEVVHGKGSLWDKMAGDEWQKFANLRLLFGYMWGMTGKKLLFMGGEFGQWQEWRHDESLDWHLLEVRPAPRACSSWVRDLNKLYAAEPALHELDNQPGGFEWIDCTDANASSVISFMRQGEGRGRDRLRAELHAGAAAELPDRRARGRGTGRKCSTPTPGCTAARTSATAAGCTRSVQFTAGRTRRRSPCRR